MKMKYAYSSNVTFVFVVFFFCRCVFCLLCIVIYRFVMHMLSMYVLLLLDNQQCMIRLVTVSKWLIMLVWITNSGYEFSGILKK